MSDYKLCKIWASKRDPDEATHLQQHKFYFYPKEPSVMANIIAWTLVNDTSKAWILQQLHDLCNKTERYPKRWVDILNEYSGPSCSAAVVDKYQFIMFLSITGVTRCEENDGDGFLKSRSGLFGKDHTLVHPLHPDLYPAEHNVQQLESLKSVSEGDLHRPPEVQPPTSAKSGSARLHSAEGSGMTANTPHPRIYQSDCRFQFSRVVFIQSASVSPGLDDAKE
ncbi:hypothetical protein DUI87_07159 [Hirundo rustica rustica]|uniref:Uncharacterized protein n=1 Tax=Hirundo rustica rustica TaxID=333673 RepID=A0A3M0KW26_HIRRU|nr:hypothetical protein DUI87_07159 [Hirundo rustica rustica]